LLQIASPSARNDGYRLRALGIGASYRVARKARPRPCRLRCPSIHRTSCSTQDDAQPTATRGNAQIDLVIAFGNENASLSSRYDFSSLKITRSDGWKCSCC